QGDSRVITYKQEEIGPRINLDDLTTLANGEWQYFSEGEPDVVTDSLGTNFTNDGEAVNGSIFALGELFTNINLTEDENGFQGTMTNANGVSGIFLTDFLTDNHQEYILTQGSYGVDSVADEAAGVIITIQEQLGTYGTLALDKNSNWTYTLDNTDSDTIGLVTGETAKDSFTINVSDGYETITQQIDVSVTSLVEAWNPLTNEIAIYPNGFVFDYVNEETQDIREWFIDGNSLSQSTEYGLFLPNYLLEYTDSYIKGVTVNYSSTYGYNSYTVFKIETLDRPEYFIDSDNDSYADVIDAYPNDPLYYINEITGTTSDDILNGTTGIDIISTLEGADVVYALASNDRITLTADATWGAGYRATNVSNDSSVGTGEKINLEGLNKFSDVIDGGDDVDTLI
ncbi:MAG: VCBS domain-containing protein, partial [Anaerolineales bacterium]|nr:VCBS domain-containing protein [Anaerolineales bacterium]